MLLDTSCMIAAVCTWHEHHRATLFDLDRRQRAGDVFVTAAPAVAEAYSVLTRLPRPHRLSAEDGAFLLEENWNQCECFALTATEYWRLLRTASRQGLTGGAFYDAVIARCARKGRADVILTWNLRHFAPLQAEDLLVTSPAGEAL